MNCPICDHPGGISGTHCVGCGVLLNVQAEIPKKPPAKSKSQPQPKPPKPQVERTREVAKPAPPPRPYNPDLTLRKLEHHKEWEAANRRFALGCAVPTLVVGLFIGYPQLPVWVMFPWFIYQYFFNRGPKD